MAWSSSQRKKRFNANWASVRKRVLERDHYRCVYVREDTGQPCNAPAHAVDHIQRSITGKDNDSLTNLQTLCDYHHQVKTERESAEARRVKRHEREVRAWYSHPAFNS